MNTKKSPGRLFLLVCILLGVGYVLSGVVAPTMATAEGLPVEPPWGFASDSLLLEDTTDSTQTDASSDNDMSYLQILLWAAEAVLL